MTRALLVSLSDERCIRLILLARSQFQLSHHLLFCLLTFAICRLPFLTAEIL